MERRTNWLNWAALVVGALALVLALGSRRDGPAVNVQVPAAPAAPAAPAPDGPFANDPRAYGRGDQFGPRSEYGRGDQYDTRGEYGPMHGHRPHFGPFSFIGGILKFFGFLLIIGLVMRFIFGRRGWGGPPWKRGWGGPPPQQGNAPSGGPQPAQPEHKEGGSDEDAPPSTGETVRL